MISRKIKNELLVNETKKGIALRLATRFFVPGVLLIGIVISIWIKAELGPRDPGGENVHILLKHGANFSEVTRQLEQAGLIHGRPFSILARGRNLDSKIRAGEYNLSPAMSSWEILNILSQGQVVTYQITIPEGLRATEIAKLLHDSQILEMPKFMDGVNNIEWVREYGLQGPSFEGYLFPETYTFSKGLSTKTVLKTFAEQFLRHWKPIETRAVQTGLTMREIIILASIVEKETGKASERPLIASVFLNRLAKGIRLQTDPTVIYGIRKFDGNLTKTHLNDSENRYNTYQFSGLPPGPIANPGTESILAIIEPERTDLFYFVARGDGSHKFSTTYQEHLKAVKTYQLRK